jgi:hypothetical protein
MKHKLFFSVIFYLITFLGVYPSLAGGAEIGAQLAEKYKCMS